MYELKSFSGGIKIHSSSTISYVSFKMSTCLFLRTARSLDHFGTYLQVIFCTSHPTLKLTKQKMSEIIQVNVPNFIYFEEIPKITKLGPKKRF